jgi:hypothetical protein
MEKEINVKPDQQQAESREHKKSERRESWICSDLRRSRIVGKGISSYNLGSPLELVHPGADVKCHSSPSDLMDMKVIFTGEADYKIVGPYDPHATNCFLERRLHV